LNREKYNLDIHKHIRNKVDSNISKWANDTLYKNIKKNVSLLDLQNYCKNKTVLIVGNSSEITTQKLGEKIDSYNIVIRLNHAHVKKGYEKHMGTKYNIWGHGFLNPSMQLREYSHIKNIIDYHIATNVYKLFNKINDNKCFIVCNNWYKTPYELQHNIEMSTGLNIILLFIKYIDSMEKLSIVGFDFLRSDNYILLSANKSKFHNSDLEEQYIKNELIKYEKYIPFNERYIYKC